MATPFNGSQTYFSRHLTDTGLKAGTKDMSSDHSGGGGDEFYVIPRPGESRLHVARMIAYYEDAAGGTAAEYGNIGAALSNGITVWLKNDTETITDITDGDPVKTNAGWAAHCYDAQRLDWGNGNDMFVVRWTFTKGGQYIPVGDIDNERFGVTINDSLVGLVTQVIKVQGYVVE